MLERQVESYLSKRVKEMGGISLKWISTVTGVPDRIVFLNKKIHLVELKTKTGALSARQLLMFQELELQGFPVTVLRSKEDVEVFLAGEPKIQKDQARARGQVFGEGEGEGKVKGPAPGR